MRTGKPGAPRPGVPANEVEPDLAAFAKWLLDDPRCLEVWGLLGARLARVACTGAEVQALELDSGDWFLVRVGAGGAVPTSPPQPPPLQGIVCFRRLVGKPESGSDPSGEAPPCR